MIEMQFNEDAATNSMSLKVRGHANSAPKGQDLVCAAVTTLLLTAVEAVTFLEACGAFQVKPVIQIENGNAQISVVANENWYSVVNNCLLTIWIGLTVVEREYPECFEVVPSNPV